MASDVAFSSKGTIMVELLTLTVERRESVGKRRNRRLREGGKTPAVLYGHKKEVVNLSVATDRLEAALRHGSRFVILGGDVSERAFIKDVQWNTWGDRVLHVDFTRVSEHEHVQLSVPVMLRGEAAGLKDGGVVKQHLHKIEIEAEPTTAAVQEVMNREGHIDVVINDLGFNEQIKVADIVAPEGVKILVDPETLVVECSPQVVVEVSEEAPADGEEPEVIGRKKAEGEEAE